MAYGLFSLGLVLGWSALFLHGSKWRARAARWLWFGLVAALTWLSPDPIAFGSGALCGALAHLLLQLGLRERRA